MSETAATSGSASPAASKHYQIILNGEPVTVPDKIVTYEEVVALAYPTPPAPGTRFTVTYRNAHHPHEGSLAPGGSVEVKKEGTIFNVRATNRS
jgi:hypothetical protein